MLNKIALRLHLRYPGKCNTVIKSGLSNVSMADKDKEIVLM